MSFLLQSPSLEQFHELVQHGPYFRVEVPGIHHPVVVQRIKLGVGQHQIEVLALGVEGGLSLLDIPHDGRVALRNVGLGRHCGWQHGVHWLMAHFECVSIR